MRKVWQLFCLCFLHNRFIISNDAICIIVMIYIRKEKHKMNVAISSALSSQSPSSAQAAAQIESDPTKSVENETDVQSTESEAGTSSKYDTLELSQDYLTYTAQKEDSTSEGPPPKANNDSETSDETAAATTENSSTASAASSTETEEDTVYSSELYSYSESKLNSLVSDGTITRSQYNTEMARRQSGSAEE